MSLTQKEIYIRRKKARIKRIARERKQLQKARRAGYLTETARFEQLLAEGLPRVFEMKPVNS